MCFVPAFPILQRDVHETGRQTGFEKPGAYTQHPISSLLSRANAFKPSDSRLGSIFLSPAFCLTVVASPLAAAGRGGAEGAELEKAPGRSSRVRGWRGKRSLLQLAPRGFTTSILPTNPSRQSEPGKICHAGEGWALQKLHRL